MSATCVSCCCAAVCSVAHPKHTGTFRTSTLVAVTITERSIISAAAVLLEPGECPARVAEQLGPTVIVWRFASPYCTSTRRTTRDIGTCVAVVPTPVCGGT